MDNRYKTFLEAWEKINQAFVLHNPEDNLEDDDIRTVTQAVYLYNQVIHIENTDEYPETYNFGEAFNYTKNKWTRLIGNYIDRAALEQFKERINKETSSKKFFNIPYFFDNNHLNGKNCLMYMLATKRYGGGPPYLTFNMRASEVTKRLLLDFLLAKRIGDYLFENTKYKVTFSISQMFQDNTVLLMYHKHEDLTPYLKNRKDKRGIRLYGQLNGLLKGKESDFKYKVHKRVFKVLRPDLYKYPTLLAKDCQI